MTAMTLPAWPQRPLFADRERPDQFVFYDVETTGLDRDFDQLIQIALVRTNAQFEIEDPKRDVHRWRCRRLPWLVPSPAALLTTGTELSALHEPSMLPQEMMVEVAETIDGFGPAFFVGFNSIRFDDEFLRRGFFAALQSPYLMPGVGSLRADAMVIAQAVHALAPGSIVVPPLNPGANGDAAQPRSFRLQALAAANGIATEGAHEAQADALTTIALMRLLTERAPAVVERMLELASKWTVIETMAESAGPDLAGRFRPLALVQTIGGVPGVKPIMALCPLPAQHGRFLTVDLTIEPATYIGLDEAELTAFVSEHWRRFPVIKANAQPILVPIDVSNDTEHVDTLTGVDVTLLQERMAMVHQALPDFGPRLLAALAANQRAYPPPVAVEQELYSGGFVQRADDALATRMAQMEPEAIAEHVPALVDRRLREHACRWVYAADPQALRPADRQRIDDLVRERLLGPCDRPWRTIAQARNELIALRVAAAERGDRAVTEHCDRIAIELHFLEERQLRSLRAQGLGAAEGDVGNR